MKELVDIVITVNSPGEVSGWLKPVVVALETFPGRKRITVFVPPCPYASGAESKVVEEIPQVEQVIGPQETVRYILCGKLPKDFRPADHGIVLFLGGDLTYAALLKKRLGYPAVAYTEGLTNWSRAFARFAMPYPWMAAKIKKPAVKRRIKVIGNLMLDAVRPQISKERMQEIMGNGTAPGLLLVPGSRPVHFQYMLAFYIKTVEKIKEQWPELVAAVSISPFVTEEQLVDALFGWGAREWGLSATYQGEKNNPLNSAEIKELGEIRTETGVIIPCFQYQQYNLMNWADLALTIPGTNTVELSSMGVPMVVTIPLNHPEEIPLEGLVGMISDLPLIGRPLKKRLLPKFQAKIKFTAWPNRLAGELVVPELIGQLSPEEVARTAVGILHDPVKRLQTNRRLRQVVGPPGAAERLVALLQEVITTTYGNFPSGGKNQRPSQ